MRPNDIVNAGTIALMRYCMPAIRCRLSQERYNQTSETPGTGSRFPGKQSRRNCLAMFTGFAPRWHALAGYAFSIGLLIGSSYLSWSFVVFPVWVFLVSICILRDSLASQSEVVVKADE
jgi:hypothetical protein